ncbi:MAG: DHH family phosphoesterase [Thermoplasmata archaeon]
MKRGIALPHDFSSRVKAAIKLVRKHSYVRVISHYDADGITAAGVLVSALKRGEKEFLATISKNLDRKMIEKLASERNECIVILDMGSGQLEALEKLNTDIVVLDHHKTSRDSERIVQVNPHLFGLDGMRDVSASGLAFIFATTMDDRNWSSAPIAITGLMGDMQHLGGFSPINKAMIDGAIDRNLIKQVPGFKMAGRTLTDMISNSFIPYFKGISGRRGAAQKFLEDLKIDPSSSPSELSEPNARKLLSMLSLSLLGQGCDSDAIEQLWGETMPVLLPAFAGLKIDDLVDLMNACGRMEHTGVGLAACLGDQQALKEAIALRNDYVRDLLDHVRKIEDGAFEARANIQVIRPAKSSLAGAVCGISMAYLLDQNKPTIAITQSDGSSKISSRGTRKLVGRGLDLSESLKNAAAAVGGIGGGHAVAAGATVPTEREAEFLKLLDEITGKQLKKS